MTTGLWADCVVRWEVRGLLHLCGEDIPTGKQPPLSLLGGLALCHLLTLRPLWDTLQWPPRFLNETDLLHSRKVLVLSHFKAGVSEAEVRGTVHFARTQFICHRVHLEGLAVASSHLCPTVYIAFCNSLLCIPATNWQTSKWSLRVPSHLQKRHLSKFLYFAWCPGDIHLLWSSFSKCRNGSIRPSNISVNKILLLPCFKTRRNSKSGKATFLASISLDFYAWTLDSVTLVTEIWKVLEH